MSAERRSVPGHVEHLDHDGCSALFAAFRVHRTPRHHTSLTRSQLDAVALDDQPRFPGHHQEQLIETRLVHPDLTAGIEMEHVRMGFT